MPTISDDLARLRAWVQCLGIRMITPELAERMLARLDRVHESHGMALAALKVSFNNDCPIRGKIARAAIAFAEKDHE